MSFSERMEEWAELCANLKEKVGVEISSCGSRVTCDPAPLDTDMDFLVFILPPPIVDPFKARNEEEGKVRTLMDILETAGYVWEGSSEHYQNVAADGFMSWRKGNVNLIVSASEFFVERHKCATALCKRLNLLNKPDRIALFQAVLYAKIWDQ